jgi:hypothetical protein
MTSVPFRSLDDALLHVAFGADDVARAAWASVGPTLDIDRLPFELHGLFPLMAQALRRLGLQPVELPRFDGVRKRLWTLNSVRLRSLEDACGLLSASDLRPMVTGGMAVLLHRDDIGLRPLTEVDVGLPPEHGEEATRCLVSAGWTVKGRRRDGFLLEQRATVIEKQGQALTLRWAEPASTTGRSYGGGDGGAPVLRMRPTAGAGLLLASPADVLAFTLVDGLSLPGYLPLRRRTDALLLGSLVDPAVDWLAFLGRVARMQAEPEVAAQVRRLADLCGAPPACVVNELATARVPMRERLVPGRGRSPAVTASLRRGRRRTSIAALTGVRRELADIWDLDGGSTVAKAAAQRVARKVAHHGIRRRPAGSQRPSDPTPGG